MCRTQWRWRPLHFTPKIFTNNAYIKHRRSNAKVRNFEYDFKKKIWITLSIFLLTIDLGYLPFSFLAYHELPLIYVFAQHLFISTKESTSCCFYCRYIQHHIGKINCLPSDRLANAINSISFIIVEISKCA